ncbi:MAG: class I SAM-dependent methyltransferase [Deltaproteobacteria bacterium]|nr:class I SAM-dependent methyltransferase [Deltaproteobacteria bacterium]
MDLRELADAARDRHPWERHRFERLFAIVRRHAPPTLRTVLDVGAGDGYVSRSLAARWGRPLEVTLWDSGYGDAPLHPDQRMRHVAEQPSDVYDLVLALDVAEHVADDVAFLRSIVARNLAPGGHLLFAVPAWPALWTSHDERLGHVRRYTPATARALLTSAGLELLDHGGLFPALAPVRGLQALGERHLRLPVPGLDRQTGEGPVAKILDFVLAAEDRLVRRLGPLGRALPGLSWWALCRR